MQTVTFSQKGTKSDANEDAYLSLPSRRLFVVADGVGGGPSGDFASRAVVNTLYEQFRDHEISQEAVVDSIRKANEFIYHSAQTMDRKGMASTVVVGWQSGSRISCFNVGDSRIYRVRDSGIEQLTRDHTKQIQKAPNVMKQVVTNAVGIKPALQVEISHHECMPGDLLLLMTDGISDLLDQETIRDIASSSQHSLAEKARALVAESERRGGQDDKSVILALMA